MSHCKSGPIRPELQHCSPCTPGPLVALVDQLPYDRLIHDTNIAIEPSQASTLHDFQADQTSLKLRSCVHRT